MRICLVESTSNQDFSQRLTVCVRNQYGVNTQFASCHQTIDYTNLTKDVRHSDVVICEVSKPSTRVGLSIALAFQLCRPVILLYGKQTQPAILSCLDTVDRENLQVVAYDNLSLEKEVLLCLDYALSGTNARFNFFITASIGVYLNWIARHYHLPRAVYLRRLIEQDLKQNQDYLILE